MEVLETFKDRASGRRQTLPLWVLGNMVPLNLDFLSL